MPCPHCTIVGQKITFSLNDTILKLIHKHFTQQDFPMDIHNHHN